MQRTKLAGDIPLYKLQVMVALSVFPLETRSFEKKQIFQEEQKTIFAIIKPVLGIFF